MFVFPSAKIAILADTAKTFVPLFMVDFSSVFTVDLPQVIRESVAAAIHTVYHFLDARVQLHIKAMLADELHSFVEIVFNCRVKWCVVVSELSCQLASLFHIIEHEIGGRLWIRIELHER